MCYVYSSGYAESLDSDISADCQHSHKTDTQSCKYSATQVITIFSLPWIEDLEYGSFSISYIKCNKTHTVS